MESTPLSCGDATKRPPRRRRRRGLIALPFVALALSGCDLPAFWAKPGVTKTSQSTFHLWQWFSVGAFVIGGFVLLLMIWSVLRYRQRGDAIPKQTQYHIPLELSYTIIPIIIVFGLFAATVVVENQVTAVPKSPYVVNVYAVQWGWTIKYPGTNALVYGQTTQQPMFEIPVNTDVKFNLNSLDVVHGFYLPLFNFSRYALPGVNNVFSFHPVQTGVYFGQCSQLCGLLHSIMWFRVKVVTVPQYEAWIASFNTPAGAKAAEAAALATASQLRPHTPVKIDTTTGSP